MKNKSNIIIVIIILILSTFTVLPIQGIDIFIESEPNDIPNTTKNKGDGETENWALIVCVGEYAEGWDILEMYKAADELKDALLKSPSWSEDHIKVIKGKNATVFNIIKGLIWLDRMEDEDDICLLHFNTHGNSISKDIPPKDEADGRDEILVTYWGLALPYANILDDTLNYFLSRLESQGTAVIIDCCHAGGFNDPPQNKKPGRLPIKYPRIKNKLATYEWMENFGKELSNKGRVVIMCCEEDEVGYVGSFTPYLLDAFRGFGDLNQDNIITAEEIYIYVKLRTQKHLQNPTIYDDYDGELPLLEISEGPIEPIKLPMKENLFTKHLFEISEGPIEPIKFSEDKGLLINKLLLENSIVCGYIKDDKTNNPLQNVNVTLFWTENQGFYYVNFTKSNNQGFYKLNVAPGQIALIVNARGYLEEIVYWIDIDENDTLWINISMTKLNEKSIVCGYIKDEITNESIQNANISLKWSNFQGNNSYNYTLSNSFGLYSINVAIGYIKLNIQAEGYLEVDWPEYHYYNITENETKWVNISLYPKPPETSNVKGYITDSKTGAPIQNANIRLYWKDNQGHKQYNYSKTNSLGFYIINVAKGSIRLYVYQENYFQDNWPENGYYNITENETKWVNLSLYPKPPETSIIKGYITDSKTEDPIQGVLVWLDWEDDQGHYQSNVTYTNSLGFYSINVAKGSLQLYFYENGYFSIYWPENGYYNITENETKWVNLSLYPKPPETSIIKGYITDSKTKDPIKNAHINLYWKDDQGHQQNNFTNTNFLGFYSFNVAKGSIRLSINAVDYFYASWPDSGYYNIYENETKWVNVTLNSSSSDYTVCGYINNNVDFSPIENASIFFICKDVKGNYYSRTTYSNKSGFYSTNLRAGIIDVLFVDAEGFFQYNSGENYLLEDEYVLWINVSMIPLPPENSKVRGCITDSETNKPIGNATVNLYWYEHYSELHYQNTTISDNLGFYCFYVAAGPISLGASADGYFHYHDYNDYEIDENETLWVNMSLEPLPPQNAIVCGYITDVEKDEPMEDVQVHLKWYDFDYKNYDHNYTWTDSNGFYLMNTAEGKMYVEAVMDGYLDEVSRLTNIYENEILWFNLSLYPRPPKNSVICGYIKDAETGEPLENADVDIHWIGCEWHHEEFLYDECTDEEGFYRINVATGELYLSAGKYRYYSKSLDRQDIGENDTLWFNASLEKKKIEVEFDRPLTAIYANNDLKLPFFKPLIFGDIEINVFVWNCKELEKFELYIDDELKLEFVDRPNYIFYSYLWTSDIIRIFNLKHTIKALAIDKEGNSDSEEIEVWKFF